MCYGMVHWVVRHGLEYHRVYTETATGLSTPVGDVCSFIAGQVLPAAIA